MNILPSFKRLYSRSRRSQASEPPVSNDRMQSLMDKSPQLSNPQASSPLFSRIPAEIRNHIFELVLTSYDDKSRPYKKGAYYYRPGHRFAQKIDTSLLSACRRIYLETDAIPASLNEHTSWYHRPPPDVLKNSLSTEVSPGAQKRKRELETIHLFTQQFWLEGQFGKFATRMNSCNASRLKITLRHTDWWWWENGSPLVFDPQQAGRPSNRSVPPWSQHVHGSLGHQLSIIKNLKEFQLELETVESKRNELDAIVANADTWEFPAADGNVLVLNQSKTTRIGWVGYKLGSNQNEGEFDLTDTHEVLSDISTDSERRENDSQQPMLDSEAEAEETERPPKPKTAKERLVADGVKFIDEHLEPDVENDDERMTYYVVTLTWDPRRDS